MNKEEIKNIIVEVLNHIGTKADVYVEQENEELYLVNIDGDDLNFLIGYHGKSLDAFQHIVNLILLNKYEEKGYINLDINNYKEKRKDKIKEITKSFIDKVRFFGEETHMPKMSAWERKQVHEIVAEYPDINEESVGEGNQRHIVLTRND